MPRLLERSRLNSEIDSPLLTDPPEPGAPEGFLLSEASLRICPAKAGTGDPDPGARAATRVPKSAGPAGGNEAMSRTPMAERAFSRARKSRRDDAPQKSNSFGLPRAREQPEI